MSALSKYTDEEVYRLAMSLPWNPQEGPQHEAYFSLADLTLYGGAAGGGKTDLAIGLAIREHQETLFIRRESKQLGAVLDRIAKLIDPERKGYSGQEGRWIIPPWDGVKRQIVIGSTPNLGDENRYQGRPRDLLVIDEAANMLEAQVRFLMGWVRSTDPKQRCRTLLCSNPPTGPEGEWLIEMFAAWLDSNYPNPAAPGELRWFAMVNGKELEVDGPDPFEVDGEKIIPQSRTFIPAKLDDNQYLRDTGYRATLMALPEPLRSQMLYGDFTAGRTDGEWQVIPSAWVEAAMNRWEEPQYQQEDITSVGVDPSRGGEDSTVIAGRIGWHFTSPKLYEGHQMPDGPSVAAKVIEFCGASHCPVNVDVIGIGASVVDSLAGMMGARVVPVTNSGKSEDTDFTGNLKFINKRAEGWWRMRDILNPAHGYDVKLPPDQRLKAELCTPTYKMQANGIKIDPKEDIIKRLGRSTDEADAYINASEKAGTGGIRSVKQRKSGYN